MGAHDKTHLSVMPKEAIEWLRLPQGGVAVDGTLGLGGHAFLMAQALGPHGHLIGIDRDSASLGLAQKKLASLSLKIDLLRGSFSRIDNILAGLKVSAVDGILLDLGISSFQLDDEARGFAFRIDGPLDMRMDRTRPVTAADIVNSSNERELADLIYKYGEERRSRQIARAIVRARPIRSTRHLADVVERAAHRTGRLHPATQVFMALRLAVNDEMGELDHFFTVVPELVRTQGRIVTISFMSLEDRKAKEAFRDWGRDGRATVLTKHPIRPSEEEVRINPASRSAKLRAVEMN